MKSYTTFFFFLFFAVCASAQTPTWDLQESGTNQHLRDIYFATNEIGYIVGDGGTVLKTTNSGLDWTLFDLDLTLNIKAVHFVNASTGFIAGNEGNKMYKTTDGGNTWSIVNHSLIGDEWQEINDLYFIDENTGFAASHTGLIRTSDGGATWDIIEDYVLVQKIDFFDQLVGYVACQQGLLKTTDGGQTWSLQQAPGDPDFSGASIVRSISAASADTVYFGASYYSAFYRSTDGGASLDYQLLTIVDLDFLSAQTGFAIRISDALISTIVKTEDMGANWDLLFTSSTAEGINLNEVWMRNEQEGWVVGDNGLIRHMGDTSTNSISNFEQAKMVVYPNPTTDILQVVNLQLPADSWRIIDITGRECAIRNRGQNAIDVSHLKAGHYVLQIESQGELKTAYFIKN